MGLPVVITASGGLPVTEATNGVGLPVEIATNGFGIAVTIVASGGLPGVGSGGGVVAPAAPALTWSGDEEDDEPDFVWDLPSGYTGDEAYKNAAAGDDGVIAYRENGTAAPLTEYIRRTLIQDDIDDDPINETGIAAVPTGVVLDFYSWIERGAVIGDISAAEEVGPIDTAPTLTLPTGVQTGQTTATVGATTDEANGTLYWVVTTGATPPSAAQVKAGQDSAGAAATASGSQAISTTGVKTANATGLSAGTTYYGHLMHEDAGAHQSNVVTSSSFVTASGAVTIASTDHKVSTADASSYTFTGVTIGATGKIIVGASGRNSGDTITSFTIKLHVPNVAGDPTGTTLTQVVALNSDSNHNRAALHICDAIGGASGDIVVAATTGIGAGLQRCGIGVWNMTGASSSTATDTDSSTADPSSVTLAVSANGAAIGYSLGIQGTSTTWTGMTEDFDETQESTVCHSGAHVNSVAGGDLSLQSDWNASQTTQPATVYASWAP